MPVQLTDVQRQVADAIQEEFPLDPAPFARIAERLGVEQSDVLDAVRSLREQDVLRQINAIFDTRGLGYASSLVAARVRPEALDEAAGFINTHPGVSHNYQRKGAFNLWYTVAIPPDSTLGLEGTVGILGAHPGIERTRLMPTLTLYKIGVKLDIRGSDGPDSRERERPFSERDRRRVAPPPQLRPFILELQRDIETVPRPFDAPADRLGVSVAEYLAVARGLIEQRWMRRFSAILNHRRAGFKANGMGVWAVPEEQVDRIGEMLANFKAVSHCYRRPTYPDWPYNLFTMIHGRSREQCEATFERMRGASGVRRMTVLYSGKEYKKVRVTYFSPEFERWERAHGPRS